MACIIDTEYSLDAGKELYYQMTADFGSLQMRLTTADTAINPSTRNNAQPCDPGLYEIYRSDTDCADAHSNTGRIVFVDSIGGQLYIYEMEDGSTIKLYQDTKIPGTNVLSQNLQVGDGLEGKHIKAISHRPMTTKEFKSFTKDGYIGTYNDKRFASWRRVSKTINFGVLFNCSAPTLAQQLEDAGYKEEEAWDYLELTNNVPFYNQLLQQQMGKMSAKKVKFLAAGSLMLEAYYKGFPGVPERTKREAEFAWKYGYVRCWGGPVRHLPEMRYMKRNAEGNVIGADKKMFGSMISNRQNQAGNSPIQCMEANIAISTIIKVWDYCREWNLKSYMYNMVHDSEDWCIYRPELELVCSLLNACSTWKREPHNGIDMCMDMQICWPHLGHQKNLYHGGVENPFKVRPIEEVVAEYNSKYGTNLQWHGCDI